MKRKARRARSRGQLIRRGDRKYLVRVYLGRVAGKRRYHAELVTGTVKQAEQVMTRLLRERDTDTFVEPSTQLVEEYLTEWLRGKGNIGPRTRLDYEERLRRDVFPTIGRLRLSQVGRQTIRSLYTGLATNPTRPLSPSTIQHTHRVLRQAFAHAVQDGLLARSPCDGAQVAIPKATREADAGTFLTPEQAHQLLQAARAAHDPWYPLWSLLLNTGVRPQEALALTWADLTGDQLTIQRALVQVDRKGTMEVRHDLKTHGSRRCILLDPSVVDALASHKSRQAAAILKAGTCYRRELRELRSSDPAQRSSDRAQRELNFIFANKNGGFLDISRVRRLWAAALARADLPPRRLYATRHTHATHLLQVTDPKTAAARLGHANPNMLLSVYAHVIPEAARGAASALLTLLEQRKAGSGAAR